MEELIFDSDGEVDVEAMRDERITRNVPPNPPPLAAQPRWLDGKCIALRFLIDSANRKNGACCPSNRTIATAVRCTERTVQRAIGAIRQH